MAHGSVSPLRGPELGPPSTRSARSGMENLEPEMFLKKYRKGHAGDATDVASTRWPHFFALNLTPIPSLKFTPLRSRCGAADFLQRRRFCFTLPSKDVMPISVAPNGPGSIVAIVEIEPSEMSAPGPRSRATRENHRERRNRENQMTGTD
jgi:hypothetical protein